MKHLILILFLSAPALAQDKINKLTVVCDAGKNPRTFNNAIDADAYARTRPCAGRTWVQADYYYNASSKPSVSSAKSSSSASSSSSLPSIPVVTGECPKARADGKALQLSEIGGYDLLCDGRHEKFTQKQCAISYATSLPMLTKDCQWAAFDKDGRYSSYVPVTR